MRGEVWQHVVARRNKLRSSILTSIALLCLLFLAYSTLHITSLEAKGEFSTILQRSRHVRRKQPGRRVQRKTSQIKESTVRLSPRGKHKLHAIPQSKDKTENESKVNFDIGVQHSTEVGHHTGDFIYGAVISGEDGASPFEDNAGGVNVTNRSAIIAEVAGIVDGATDPRDESDEGSNDVWGNEMHFDPPPPDGLPQTGVLEEVDIAKLDEHDHVAEAVLDVLQIICQWKKVLIPNQ